MTHTHLTEDEVIARSLAGGIEGVTPAASAAIPPCAICAERLASMTELMRDVSDAAERESDAAFSPDKLARQQARILNRLANQGQVARVIAFPNGHGHRASTPVRPVRRWVAGAAAAGLIIGMVAGHLVHELPSLHVARHDTQASTFTRDPAPLHASALPTSDDEFMREVETALASGPRGLRRLDRVTPVAWEQR